jgi:cytoskeletal protein RodZ
MGLEIKISAEGMLRCLINAGIEATDAKAVIFDLLQYPEKVTQEYKKPPEKVEEVKPKKKLGRPPGKKEASPSEPSADDNEDTTEDTDDNDESEDEEEDTTTIRRPRRINFKNFGGPAKTIVT